jgi:hypothetical protein
MYNTAKYIINDKTMIIEEDDSSFSKGKSFLS